ncbi:zinc finger MYM-type protein 1-like [Hydra vulgaris]|uniref:zinc finger MYM-type protein 1-like n=1 Tax=Hydra vulgaris TaxID=6087 RepID=UPI0032E9C958
MKYPKLTHFLKPAVPASSVLISTNNFDCDYLGTRLESDGLIYDSNAKSNVSHGLICESNATTNPLIFLSDDPSDWPDNVSNAQKCDVVKRGLKKIEIDFPKNSKRRRFSMSYYNRKMKNGEIFERSWLIYSLNSDKVFCFCCKLFGITSSLFRKGINTWEGLSKKLKEHETCSAHLKYFEHWMTLRKANQATIDEQQQKLLHKERVFWRSVLERILDITLFFSARNLAFRGSDTAIGSKSNGNFLGVFELLAKVGINISENFFGYLTVNDTTGKGLIDAFLNQAKKWDLNILDCRGQSYDNGANMKGKLKGVQDRLLEMNPKTIYVPCANHSLNLVIVDGALSSISAISFFGVLKRLYTPFSSSPPRWEIFKSCVEISVKPQSDTRWESKINCVKPLRYYLKEILEAHDRLEKHAFEKKDGATAIEVRSLIEYIRTWPFLLSIIIWYDVLFQINKSSKLLQSSTTSLDILASEIKATNTFLYEYRETGFTDAHIKAQEIAEELGIEKVFPTVRLRKKKMYSYECADETRQPEHQYKADFFLPLIDMSIASVKERFEQVSIFTNLFDFLYRSESLIKACNENSLTVFCTNLQTKLGDIDSEDLEMELKRFVIVVQEDKNTNLKSAYDFLNYVYKEELQETYSNLVIALRIILTSPVTVASAERSFSKLKLIKTFHRSTMVDERLSSLAMLSIENEVAKKLSYEGLTNKFANFDSDRPTQYTFLQKEMAGKYGDKFVNFFGSTCVPSLACTNEMLENEIDEIKEDIKEFVTRNI